MLASRAGCGWEDGVGVQAAVVVAAWTLPRGGANCLETAGASEQFWASNVRWACFIIPKGHTVEKVCVALSFSWFLRLGCNEAS